MKKSSTPRSNDSSPARIKSSLRGLEKIEPLVNAVNKAIAAELIQKALPRFEMRPRKLDDSFSCAGSRMISIVVKPNDFNTRNTMVYSNTPGIIAQDRHFRNGSRA